MNFISETPWWLPLGCWAAGVVLFISGNTRLKPRMKYGGMGVVGLGFLIALVSYLLDSPRENAIARTKALVAAVQKRDWTKMGSLLHPEVGLVGWKGRAEIVDGAEYYAERYELKSLSLTGIDAIEVNGDVNVSMVVMADFKEAAGVLTRWKLEWTETKEGWVLAAMEPLGGPLIDAAAIEGRFRGPLKR
ncbi:MAG: hypothetical protein NTU53_09380 [Planctomycetota bacterium]|nr:hypothetical protein [Planctomycetota bacterium]